jgi:hypothetical protein
MEADEEELLVIPAIWLTVCKCTFTLSLILIFQTLNKIQKENKNITKPLMSMVYVLFSKLQ